MKSLIRTYVNQTTDDQIRVMANSHGLSVSALTAELINQALNNEIQSSVETTAKILEEQLYLHYFTLSLLLDLQVSLDDEQYESLKQTSREWAQNRLAQLEGRNV